ncbi:MAG: hypothetical protein QOC82_1619 [Frankiaceae bacterium]|jgi:hypothetical protein|nr:hypothetical protein [Frankiaceae bacterium]
MRLTRRAEPATALALLLDQDTVDTGQLVRALSRAVVHVPMPNAPAEPRPRPAAPADGDLPLYIVEDDEGRHAFVYSSPRALVDAWGPGVTAASVRMAALLARWPDGTDLVIDAGTPRARQVPPELLRQAGLDAAGVPTPAALRPSPAGWDLHQPSTEPVQVIGVTRTVAESAPAVLRLWRAVTVDREPDARPTLNIVVEFAAATDGAEISRVMTQLGRSIGEVDPQPVRLLAYVDGAVGDNALLVHAIRHFDDPYWERVPAPA